MNFLIYREFWNLVKLDHTFISSFRKSQTINIIFYMKPDIPNGGEDLLMIFFLGIGISKAQHASKLAKLGADGIIISSAIIDVI